MFRRELFLAAAALILMAGQGRAQEPEGGLLPPQMAIAVDGAVASEMRKQGVAGAAVGVILEGRIVHLKGYGLADREMAVPVTTRTVFNWASNSKPLAAVAAMQLVERKQLDLDADVRKYIPEFPDKGAVITVRHVLAHQSGIPHYSNGLVVPTTREYAMAFPFRDPMLALDKFNQSPLIFKPGDKVSYSSYAYILLSAVIQRAGKEPFQVQVKNRIEKPLGLRSLQSDVEWNHQEDWAAGYIKTPDGKVIRAREQANYWKHGAGGFKSDVRDFARWARALASRNLVTGEIEKIMWTPQTTSGGERTSWGLGFTVEDQGGLKVSHNGKQDEATTRLVIHPGSRRGVVVMTNCGFANVGAISTAIIKELDGK